jgi:ribosomal protein L33
MIEKRFCPFCNRQTNDYVNEFNTMFICGNCNYVRYLSQKERAVSNVPAKLKNDYLKWFKRRVF